MNINLSDAWKIIDAIITGAVPIAALYAYWVGTRKAAAENKRKIDHVYNFLFANNGFVAMVNALSTRLTRIETICDEHRRLETKGNNHG